MRFENGNVELTLEEFRAAALYGTAELTGYEEGGYGANSIIRDREGETLTFKDLNEAYTALERNCRSAVSEYLANLDMEPEQRDEILEVIRLGNGNPTGLTYSLDGIDLDTLDTSDDRAIYDISRLSHWKGEKLDTKGYARHVRTCHVRKVVAHLDGILTDKQLTNRRRKLNQKLAKFD